MSNTYFKTGLQACWVCGKKPTIYVFSNQNVSCNNPMCKKYKKMYTIDEWESYKTEKSDSCIMEDKMKYTKELHNDLRKWSNELMSDSLTCSRVSAVLDEIERLKKENEKLSLSLELLHATISDVF